jgi:tetratricopeptide (TPR) repeat protein
MARALDLFERSYSGGIAAYDEQEALCREALPAEERRGEPRRLALLWRLLGLAEEFLSRDDEAVAAKERALTYSRLAGDAPSHTDGIGWLLFKGSHPADEALRVLEELAAGWPPGTTDLDRALLLAMLGRSDEAWPLAEAAAEHLREVTGAFGAGLPQLAAIAMIEGDRQRAVDYHAELIEGFPPGSDGVAMSYWLLLARDLCHLGRFEEAEPLLRQARAIPIAPLEQALGGGVEALLLAARGELDGAETSARAGIDAAEKTENLWLQAWGYEDLAVVLERRGQIEETRAALERAVALAERKRCLPFADRLRGQLVSLGG